MQHAGMSETMSDPPAPLDTGSAGCVATRPPRPTGAAVNAPGTCSSTTTPEAVRLQALADDAWNAACLNGGANCPPNAGGDFDFGASVIMAELPDGTELLLAGQKSGDVYALSADPDSPDGKLVWQRQVSNAAIGPNLAQTTTNGGVHWGMALSGQSLLVAAADPERVRPEYIPRPGLHALDVASGEVLWFQAVTRGCEIAEEDKPMIGLQNMRAGKKVELEDQYRCSFYYGLSAAVLATPELIFSAGLDGKIRAFDIASGDLLWQDATARAVDADNGISGHGGAIEIVINVTDPRHQAMMLIDHPVIVEVYAKHLALAVQ